MSRRAFNFSAGPAALPTSVLERAQRELLDWGGTGMSILEMSHRDAGGPVQRSMQAAERALRALLGIDDEHAVLFAQGGAHGQFAAVPLHLLDERTRGGYLRTGFWSERAQQEGARFGETFVVADAARHGGVRLPDRNEWQIPEGAAYVHLCANETIQGLELHDDPEAPEGVPLVADFTSTLLSRPVDISRYGVVYASSGKNLGPAGFAVVIVRRSLLERGGRRGIPSILDWALAASTEPIPSLVSTPPTFAIYLCSLVLEDLLARGGVEAAARRASARAERIYAILDASRGFYENHVHAPHRSRMNVPFRIAGGDPELERLFTREAEERGMHQLFGHPRFGGQRITLYHGVPDDAVEAVADHLEGFARRHASSRAV